MAWFISVCMHISSTISCNKKWKKKNTKNVGFEIHGTKAITLWFKDLDMLFDEQYYYPYLYWEVTQILKYENCYNEKEVDLNYKKIIVQSLADMQGEKSISPIGVQQVRP